MGAIIGIRGGTIFKERAYSWTTDYLASGNHFFSIFQRLLPVIVFFLRLVGTMFQENPSFRLVEMDFRANNGFRKKKEKL